MSMGVYIDMEMPPVEDEFVEVMIYGDGKVIKTGKSWRCKEDGKCYYESLTPEKFFHATEIPEPHGDLIGRDALLNKLQALYNEREDEARYTGSKEIKVSWNDAVYQIIDAPTIIEAEEGNE